MCFPRRHSVEEERGQQVAPFELIKLLTCTSAEIKSPSSKYLLIICSSSAERLLSSPPGRFTDESSSTESRREFVSTRQRFCPTSSTRATTTSPISPT